MVPLKQCETEILRPPNHNNKVSSEDFEQQRQHILEITEDRQDYEEDKDIEQQQKEDENRYRKMT